MVETRTLWQKHTDEHKENDKNLPRTKPLYKYRIGMTNSSHSENGVIWWTVESTLTPEEEVAVLTQLYPEHDDIDNMAQFFKESYPEQTEWQIWHKELNKYVGIPFDGCCNELFDWERNKDVTIDEKIFALENGHKFVPIPGDDIIPDYQATFMFMREPRWHYTLDGVDWI